MAFGTVTLSSLGANCWSPARVVGSCATCGRYDTCTYPERVADLTYDGLREKARRLKQESEDLYREAGRIARRNG